MAAVLAVPFLLGGCVDAGGGEIGTGSAAAGGAPPQTTTTTNPYAVPAVIDAAYVNLVLAGLDAVMGDTIRLVASTRTMPPIVVTRLRSIYANDRRLQLAIDSYQEEVQSGLAGIRAEPGNRVTVVDELLSVSRSCIFARVRRDYRPVTENPTAPSTQWVALVPLDESRDQGRFNRTGWALAYDGFPPNLAPPDNPCPR